MDGDPFTPPAVTDVDQPAFASAVTGWLLPTVNLLISGVVTVMLLIAIPRFAVIFKDLGVQLPALTELLLDCWPWALVLMGAALGLPPLVVQAMWPRSRWRLLLPAVLMVASLALLALATTALFLPLFKIVEQLGQTP